MCSEGDWISGRKVAVEQASAKVARRGLASVHSEAKQLGKAQRKNTHEIEESKLEGKARLQLVQCAERNHLLPAEMDADLEADVAHVKSAREKADRKMQAPYKQTPNLFRGARSHTFTHSMNNETSRGSTCVFLGPNIHWLWFMRASESIDLTTGVCG